jgi:hypothetical protein
MGCNGQLASSKGPARMGIRRNDQGTASPSKGYFLFFLYLNMHHTYPYNMCLYVLDEKETLCEG